MNPALDVSTYARMLDPEPADDYVARRSASLKELRSRFLKRRRVPDLIATVSGVCEVFRHPAAISEGVCQQIEDAIKKNDDAFVADGQYLELGLWAVAAINDSIGSGSVAEEWEGWSVPDVLAGCVWSALSYLPKCNGRRLESLRGLTVQNARDRLHLTGLSKRGRYEVPTARDFRSKSVNRQTYAAAVRAIDELQLNAILDREEIDISRWAMAGESRIHGKEMESLSSESRAVTAGVEIGALMQTPPSLAQFRQVLHGVECTKVLSLRDLIAALGEGSESIASSFADTSLFKEAAAVFPLLSGICSGEVSGPGSEVRRPMSEWGARALLEHTLIRVRL